MVYLKKVIHLVIQAGVNTALASFYHIFHLSTGNKLGSKVIKRERKHMDEIFRDLGPKLTRRAY